LFSKKTFITKELHNLEENELFLREFYIKNPLSNSITPVEISFARINPDDEFKRFVGVIRDVTEQKKADKLRDDFIATLTHDLRTPLLAAIQTLKFFLDGALGNLEEKQKLLLSTMQKSNEDLLGLVNALLEVYKYDAEKLVLSKADFNIYELTQHVYNELKPLADSKMIEFNIDCENKNLEIFADRSELRRVICNLCGNAINYTNENGKVTITIKSEGKDLIFSVSDTGCGIPQEDIPNMFQRFSQGTSKKRSTGTGLGLYLSRQIIESHGGKIWLESVLNKGSEFSFLLTDTVRETIGVNK
jgi:signal transduction histidine kinase